MELCSICLDDIIPGKNVLVTECGHTFHCSCLMKNTAHNGFGCPYCRTEMASIPDDETITDSDEESIYSSDEDDYDDDDDVLTSFRMFHQRISSDDIEEEPIIFDEIITTPELIPSAEYISDIFIRQGVSVKDLVRCLLIEHEEYEDDYIINRKSESMFGRMRVIISNYLPYESEDVPPALISIPPGR